MEQQTVQDLTNDQPVPVYILSESSRTRRTQVTREMFNDPMFTANIVTTDTPKDLHIENIPHKKAEEIYRVRRLLEYSKSQNDKDIIIIKDTSVTKSSPESIAEAIRSILETEDRADITYLSSWLDDCENLTNKRYIANKTSVVAKSTSPNGIQALLISSQGREILLGERTMKNGSLFGISNEPLSKNLTRAIEAGDITADVIIPSIFEYDVANRGKTWKNVQCRTTDIDHIIPSTSTDSGDPTLDPTLDPYEQLQGYVGISPVVLIFLIFIILFIIWAIYYYVNK